MFIVHTEGYTAGRTQEAQAKEGRQGYITGNERRNSTHILRIVRTNYGSVYGYY